MSIKRYGTVQTGAGGKSLPFARAVEADGWLYVSGQVAMESGEIVEGNIIAQTHKTIANVLAILKEAGYGVEGCCAVRACHTSSSTSWLRGMRRCVSHGDDDAPFGDS